MAEEFDAIIIDAGQSGPFLAVRLAKQGQKVAIIEREHLGGTCVNDGCTPTKTLIASARCVLALSLPFIAACRASGSLGAVQSRGYFE